MKLAFFSIVLNHHQVQIADELYRILGNDFYFVELSGIKQNKGGILDFSSRPYLIPSWQSQYHYERAMRLANTLDICVFSGAESLPFQVSRLENNLMSFDMGERVLKRGILNLASPRLLKYIYTYNLNRWKTKPLFKLTCSAFAAQDYNKLGLFKNKCYKWGYFTAVDENYELKDFSNSNSISFMWCARFLKWKHPEAAIELSRRLRKKGYKFTFDIYGSENNIGPHDRPYAASQLQEMIDRYNLGDNVKLCGNHSNSEIIHQMRLHDIFIFTSDKQEGWGAVANESMSNGCLLIASNKIGSVPYLIKDGVNGFMYEDGSIDSLEQKVEHILLNRDKMIEMRRNAILTMQKLWNAKLAVRNLLSLCNNLLQGKDTDILEGPCSKA